MRDEFHYISLFLFFLVAVSKMEKCEKKGKKRLVLG